jgi:hypothetical protein
MLRAIVASLAILNAMSFELVSQTFDGNMTMKYSTPGMPTPTRATVKVGIDMDGVVKFGMNQHIVIDMPQYKMTTETISSSIFDASTKRYTMYAQTTMKGPVHMPSTPAICKYFDISTLPASADFGKCINGIMASTQPIGSEDGLQKYELKMPVPSVNASASEDVYVDKDMVIKKLVGDVEITGAHAMTMHMEMIDMNAKAGAPDASFFVVPKEWGACTEEKLPAMPTQNNPMLKAFLHCMGQGSSQAFVAV